MRLYEELKRLGERETSFHVPGHKGRLEKLGLFTDLSFDTTETFGTDDLAEPGGILLEAMERAKGIYNTEGTFFGVGGSTMCLYAALYSVLSPEGTLIVARNAHKSVTQGLSILRGSPRYLSYEDVMAGNTDALEDLSWENVDGALFVSPDYYGNLPPLKVWVDFFHAKKIPVIVDEAHGAHLPFYHREQSALEAGADLVIHSAHKTLPCLTGTSLLHVQGDFLSPKTVGEALGLFTTSSPSYVLLASLEGGISFMEREGRRRLASLEEEIRNFWREVAPFGWRVPHTPRDETKLYLTKEGIVGGELYHYLYENYGLAMELYDSFGVLAVATVSDGREELSLLGRALREFQPKKTMVRKKSVSLPLPRKILEPWEVRGRERERVPISQSVGRIGAKNIVPYPPGIPLLVFGEEISHEMAEIMVQLGEDGIVLYGVDHGMVEVCK